MAARTTRFDQMFDSLFTLDTAVADGPGAAPSREVPGVGRVVPSSQEPQIQNALALFHAGHYAHCLNQLRKLEATEGDDPRVAALLSTCNALVEGRLSPAIRRCTELIERAFYIPDLYCALGILLFKSRQRNRAYQVLRKGLQIDPCHQGLQSQLQQLGVRRKPLLSFLSRAHPANRVLGILRARLSPA